MEARIDLELALTVTLDCRYTLDDAYGPAVLGRAPDRCSPAEGGNVCELEVTAAHLTLADERGRTLEDGPLGADAMAWVLKNSPALDDLVVRRLEERHGPWPMPG